MEPGFDAQLIVCPECNLEFVLPSITGSTELPDDAEGRQQAEQKLAERESELNNLRIRKVSLMKRATIRTRSYVLIALLSCSVLLVQCLWNVFKAVRGQSFRVGDFAYAVIATLCIWGTIYFSRRSKELLKEINQSSISAPTTPPSFEELSNGTQRDTRFDEIR